MLERFRGPIFIAILIAIVGGIVLLISYRPAPAVITIIPPPPSATPAPTATPGPLKVYVTGAVVRPGQVYSLPADSRITDAIDAAGGLAANADSAHVNLAQLLHDGDQVNVPAVGTTAGPVVSSGGPTATAGSKSSGSDKATHDNPVHINSASLGELQRLPGVGPAMAQKILDYRSQHGAFKSMDDLSNVSGVGPAKVKDWDGLIAFD